MVDKVIGDFTEKTAPVAGDMLLIADSEATNAYKRLSIGNLLDGLSLQNEVMNFPANVGIDIDLDAAGQWWDKVGTPTTAVTMVDVAGEAGITETYEYALKTTADASGEGFYQRYTYADQPRIKSGRKLSAVAAIWVGTAGSTVTMELTTSASTTKTTTATAQAWTICQCENLTLDGTYVDLKFTINAADTFYVVPLGVNIGEWALRLPPRGLVYRHLATTVDLVLLGGSSDPNTWTDVDCTSNASNITACVNLHTYLGEDVEQYLLYHRPNGTSNDTLDGYITVRANAIRQMFQFPLIVDDGQIFEYKLDRASGSGTLYDGAIRLTGYWEWE